MPRREPKPSEVGVRCQRGDGFAMHGNRMISATIILLFGSCATGLAAPSAAMKSACAGDRTRFCNSFVGKPSEMQKCMQAHRAEWSNGCKAAAEGNTSLKANKVSQGGCAAEVNGHCLTAAKLNRHEQCAAYVQWKYLPQNGGSGMDHRHSAPAELRRCMQGEPMD
jgi:hypothetical protein